MEVAAGLGLALLLERAFPARRWLTLVILAPYVLSTIVVSAIWRAWYHYDVGFLNTVLRGIGLPGAAENIAWRICFVVSLAAIGAMGAQAFATAHGIERAVGSYAELVDDPAVDVVYIASPHSEHAAQALLAIAASGSMSTARPSTMRNPTGVFIQALAMTTNTADRAPLTATTIPANKCIDGVTILRPYR